MSTLAEDKHVIDGHTVSFASSGAGINPWYTHYASEHNIPMWSLNVCRSYALIDGEEVYCIERSHDWMSLRELVRLEGLTWDDFMEYFKACWTKYEGKLSEMIASLEKNA